MTDEKLRKAKELKKEIEEIESILNSEKLWIWNGYISSSPNFRVYRSEEIKQQLRKMLADRMKALQQEYDAL